MLWELGVRERTSPSREAAEIVMGRPFASVSESEVVEVVEERERFMIRLEM